MATINLFGSSLGNALNDLLIAPEIQAGDAPSYQLCKTIAAYHPLGAKMSDSPINMAQSQARDISIPSGPEERLKEAFLDEWNAINADKLIFNLARTARIYGIASIAMLTEGTPSDRPINLKALPEADIGFNVLDPLNTAGSLVLNQDPNSIDFQKVTNIAVGGQPYHRTRTITLMNENPLYIEYTTSAFGFVGRSVYQRPLYPLKSFIQTMITDDLISLKSGVLIAKIKGAGSVVDQIMAAVAGVKRAFIKEAVIGSVINVEPEEDIVSLNLQNIDGAYGMARKNILENIAVAADMPAKLLNAETFAEGFGEGTEDAKHVAQYVSRIRVWMEPAYEWMTNIVQYRAWNQEFFKGIQQEFKDEYGQMGYAQALYKWRNAFHAEWPNLLEEPDSEKIKVDDVKLKAVIAIIEVLLPILDPHNKAMLVQWGQDIFNEMKMLFPAPLDIDIEALENYEPPAPEKPVDAAPPFSGRDSADVKRIDWSRVAKAVSMLDEAEGRLPQRVIKAITKQAA